jgi:uncharacterized protein with NRDE domain
VCLLIALFQVVPGAPLIVAANRDEQLDRPAVAMTVLRDSAPRILGGRDELAGGTWLAVNEHGLVAGLTNQPSAAGRDPAKRSRGELPLAFAVHDSASAAVAAVQAELDPAQYNPCWMLVGDRSALYSVVVAGQQRAVVQQLPPGVHILENAPLQPASAKASLVGELAAPAARAPDAATAVAVLEAVLRGHDAALPQGRTDDTGRTWPPEISAPCVHTPGYGTRSAMSVVVPVRGRPHVRVAEGRPCETPFRDVMSLWSEALSRGA